MSSKIKDIVYWACFLTVLGLVLSGYGGAEAKICWKPCTEGDTSIVHVDIDGCRRRTGRNGQPPRFRCDGVEGPPCIVKRGDTVTLNVDYEDKSVQAATQEVYWMGPITIPWIGMDNNATKHFTRDGLRFPLKIMEAYPPGNYHLKWMFKNPDNLEELIGCFKYQIKIL